VEGSCEYISSRGQQTRSGLPACGLGKGLTTHRKKKATCYEMYKRASDFDGHIGNEKWI
jgi:hypothetical protein